MKKIYFFFFFCSIFVAEIKAQSLMTVAEIYDYNVGDIFVTRWGGYYAPPNHIKNTITNKYYNLAGDTLFYIFDQNTYQGCYPPPCTGYTSSSTNNIVSYSNLNDTIGKGLGVRPTSPCIDTNGYTGTWLDTTLYEPFYCNKLTTEINYIVGMPILFDTCWTYFEATWGYYYYSKGLGETRYYNDQCAFGGSFCQMGYYLEYYKKGNDSCGIMPLMSDYVGITVYDINNKSSIYPNPFTSQTTISFSEEQKNTTIKITDVIGKEIMKLNFTGRQLTIDRAAMKSGIYFVQITDEKKNTCNKKIIIQ